MPATDAVVAPRIPIGDSASEAAVLVLDKIHREVERFVT